MNQQNPKNNLAQSKLALMNQKQQGYNLTGSTDRLLKNNEIPIRYFNSGGGGGTIQETALKVK